MTRINAGVHPRELPRAALLAEHREIVRIPNGVRTGRYKLERGTDVFCLGPGHVRFFYRRLGYLRRRYESLHEECLRCEYRVAYMGSAWDSVPVASLGNWTPTPEDRALVVARLKERGHELIQLDETKETKI